MFTSLLFYQGLKIVPELRKLFMATLLWDKNTFSSGWHRWDETCRLQCATQMYMPPTYKAENVQKSKETISILFMNVHNNIFVQ